MKTAIIYTVLALVNLIAYTVGISMLPSSVPVHVGLDGLVDRMGSPWVFVTFPAVAALLAAGIWVALLTQKGKAARYLPTVLAGMGALFFVLGWVVLVFLAMGKGLGESATFPLVLTICLPLSVFFIFLGNYFPVISRNAWLGIRTRATLASDFVWSKTHRLAGTLLFGVGIIGAIAAIVFACLPKELGLEWVAAIILCGLLLISVVCSIIYASVLYKKEKNSEQSEQNID